MNCPTKVSGSSAAGRDDTPYRLVADPKTLNNLRPKLTQLASILQKYFLVQICSCKQGLFLLGIS